MIVHFSTEELRSLALVRWFFLDYLRYNFQTIIEIWLWNFKKSPIKCKFIQFWNRSKFIQQRIANTYTCIQFDFMVAMSSIYSVFSSPHHNFSYLLYAWYVAHVFVYGGHYFSNTPIHTQIFTGVKTADGHIPSHFFHFVEWNGNDV